VRIYLCEFQQKLFRASSEEMFYVVAGRRYVCNFWRSWLGNADNNFAAISIVKKDFPVL
jgi:hypothetical protein